MFANIFFLLVILSSAATIYSNQDNLYQFGSMNNGASITTDMQSYIRSILAKAYSLFGANLPSTAIYLSTNLNKAYNGTWSVIISSHLNSATMMGSVMNSQNDSWWAVWSGQNPSMKNTSYFISKVDDSEQYKYIQVGSGGHINGSGLQQDQIDRLYGLIKGKPQNYQLKANQVKQIASTIVNCNWNVFFEQFTGANPEYSGYVATSEERFIHGRIDAKEGKDAFYFTLSCV